MENQNKTLNVWDVWVPQPALGIAVSVAKAAKNTPVEPTAPEPVEPASAPEEPEPTPRWNLSNLPKPTFHKKAGFRTWARRVVLASVPLLFVLLIVWVAGNVYFVKFKLGGGLLQASKSDSQLQAAVNAKVASYKLAITYPSGKQKTFPLSAAGIKASAKQTIVNARVQEDKLANRLKWWQPIPIKLSIAVNQAVLQRFVAKNTLIIMQPAKDASLTISNGAVKVTGSSAGKEYGLDNPTETLLDWVKNLKAAPVKLKTLALNPVITEDQLVDSKARLDKTLKQNITFIIGNQAVTASPNDIAAWLDLSPDKKKGTIDISVNSGKVQDYIENLAGAYIHPPRAQVNMVKNGKTLVLVQGVNGVDVTNKDTVATSVAKNLLKDRGMQLSLTINNVPYSTIKAGNYKKWIEVDLTNRRLYAYESNRLVNTLLTSDGRPDTPTVTGQYKIYAKFVSQDMRGANVDGSSYFQPNVPWINYFYSDYAIHGNYWRPTSYFGNVDSSHGCVGLLPSDAEWVYNWAPIGTPVIIHY